ncbi:MAG: DUF2993 domain-containing protein [Nostocales cyanobacterium]|nr:MAG: DUF2993 domain-containing protein [Nostocales cyanobacterium]TAF12345.1 MAG: DUF2993 domain-containing protein [Nostocales cyanobacterium]
MRETETAKENNRKVRLVTKTLTAAIKLWLKTQLSQVSQMEVEIGASDRQLLSGCIPIIHIEAKEAVYQGIHVTSIQLTAENIQINIGGILKGKPLKLLEVVPIVGELIVEEQDLNNSLSSALLSTALNDLLPKLSPATAQNCQPISWEKIFIGHQYLTLVAIIPREGESTHLEIETGLELINTQEIQLAPIIIKHNQSVVLENKSGYNSGYNLDLGSDVALEEITLNEQKLVCRGRVNINP